MWRHTGLSYVYVHLCFCRFCYFYLSSLDTCQPFSCLVLLHGFTKTHQIVRHWQDKREESDCELKLSLRSCSQTSSFNKKWHFFHCSGEWAGREQDSTKMVWLLSNKVRGWVHVFWISRQWVIGAELQRNCQCIKWYHISSDIQNSYVFVRPKGSPLLNWTLCLLSNRVLKLYE